MEQDMRAARINGLVSRLLGTVLCRLGRFGRRRSSDGTEHHVQLECLSPHILSDLGISADHARDLAARERGRFLP